VKHSIEAAIFLATRGCYVVGPGRIESEMRIELPRPRDVSAPDFNPIRHDLSLRLHGPRKAA
jgi:NitT/TauT family transport system ATP-binding protein